MLIVNSGGSLRSYWALEDRTDCKHEYIGGQIISRTDMCARRSEIVQNVGAELRHRERGRGWSMLVEIRVKIQSSGAYVWPDITVYEKPGHFESRRGREDESLLDPILIMEVFSPVTEAFVRGAKWSHYQGMPSLREYVLVAQDAVRVERFVRENTGWRHSAAVTSLDAVLHLTSIACELPVSDIYDGVDLAADTFATLTTPVGQFAARSRSNIRL